MFIKSNCYVKHLLSNGRQKAGQAQLVLYLLNSRNLDNFLALKLLAISTQSFFVSLRNINQ